MRHVLNEIKKRFARKKAKEQAASVNVGELLATPETIAKAMLIQFPDSLPKEPKTLEHFARLQGRQDVIRYLNGLIYNNENN